MSDRSIRITVQLPHHHVELVRRHGWGDNPRFYANEVDSILDGMKVTLREMIAVEYGPQSTGAALND